MGAQQCDATVWLKCDATRWRNTVTQQCCVRAKCSHFLRISRTWEHFASTQHCCVTVLHHTCVAQHWRRNTRSHAHAPRMCGFSIPFSSPHPHLIHLFFLPSTLTIHQKHAKTINNNNNNKISIKDIVWVVMVSRYFYDISTLELALGAAWLWCLPVQVLQEQSLSFVDALGAPPSHSTLCRIQGEGLGPWCVLGEGGRKFSQVTYARNEICHTTPWSLFSPPCLVAFHETWYSYIWYRMKYCSYWLLSVVMISYFQLLFPLFIYLPLPKYGIKQKEIFQFINITYP